MRKALVVLALGALASASHAHELSLDECLEGSEFILHAAMSRDGGMGREDFVGKVRADLEAIQQVPPEYRWFAQDEDDERFLVSASEDVFDMPRAPARHQSDFLQACMGRTSADAGVNSSATGVSPNGMPSTLKEAQD